MNRRIAIAAALALSLGTLPLMAQGPGGGFGGGQPPMGQGRGRMGGGPGPGIVPGLNQLDLTDTQKEQIRAVMEAERQSGPGQAMRDAEKGLHTAIFAQTQDLAAIARAKAALLAAQAAELDHRIELQGKIAQILTPAQRQQLLSLQPPGPRGRGPGGL